MPDNSVKPTRRRQAKWQMNVAWRASSGGSRPRAMEPEQFGFTWGEVPAAFRRGRAGLVESERLREAASFRISFAVIFDRGFLSTVTRAPVRGFHQISWSP